MEECEDELAQVKRAYEQCAETRDALKRENAALRELALECQPYLDDALRVVNYPEVGLESQSEATLRALLARIAAVK